MKAIVTRRLPVKLNQAETVKAYQELTGLLQRHNDETVELARIARERRDTIRALDVRILELATEIRAGERMAEIEVEWREDGGRLEMVCYRLDNQSEVDRRPMTDDERQRSFPQVTETPRRKRKESA